MVQILNHIYSFYNSSSYEEWATIFYKRDNQHPTPSWNSEDRDYWHILTNNNGDSIAELTEKQLSFPTQDYNDGDYRIVVEVYDEFGNFDIDSMDVKFVNGNTTGMNSVNDKNTDWMVFPNPAIEKISLVPGSGNKSEDIERLRLYDNQMKMVRELNLKPTSDEKMLSLEIAGLEPGIYFLEIVSKNGSDVLRVVIL